MKIRCALIFIATTMFISWSPVTSVCYAMPRVDSSKVVNGAAKPKPGAAGAADRCVKLVGSGTKVAGSVAKETAKGAAKGAAVGAATSKGNKDAIVVGAAVGATEGACKGYKKGVEKAKYPKQ